jgi:hypothetical protein
MSPLWGTSSVDAAARDATVELAARNAAAPRSSSTGVYSGTLPPVVAWQGYVGDRGRDGNQWSRELVGPGVFISGNHFPHDISTMSIPAGVKVTVKSRSTPIYGVNGTGGTYTAVGPRDFSLLDLAPGGGFNGVNDNIETLTIESTNPQPVAQAEPTTSTGYTPANVPLDYLKFLFQQAGCNPINLTEGDLTVKFWRTLPSMDAIKNDIRGYAVAYSTGSGTQAQKDYCQPPSTGHAEGDRYMPPQTRNTNIKRTTKTCATCPSAPLLSSLPTPSIAHNVNLPHYCQRITDDGGL